MQLHQIEGYIQSIYLAEYEDKLLLLDGASRADVPVIENFITNDLHKPLTALKSIIVTHMHPDHAGGAEILRRNTGCSIITANVEGNWYRGLDGRLMHLADIALALWVSGRLNKPRKNLWYSPYLKADIMLNDGQSIPGFEDWCIYFTQGHTDRDISVHHKPTNQLYVADLMVKVKGRFIPPYPVFYPNRYRKSIQKVRELNPCHILLAHGAKVSLQQSDFDGLLQRAPNKPASHWHAVKTKLKKAIFGN